MNKRITGLVGLFLMIGFVAGCAMIAEKTRGKTGVGGGIITGGVASLSIKGPSQATVGQTVTLTAEGYDERSASIKRPGAVKPTWKSDNSAIGALQASEGKTITVQCLAPGVVYISATQGKADTIHAIEVK
ncbi:MAG: hypothetical protein COS41_05065 [Elusimicrobia bacterium CG03_land_8_20_14_0_80_50_18]|nr:MAG: hypothetical protein COS41_05065 [Elusimicrobia bacterium CG03_land_8_20_14_0_80_50_18]PIX16158.1 MAG: hypothetical protein COZ72_01700 [Elusimicrobia bacterium CG_4_8_14_3_um_filter_50_9]